MVRQDLYVICATSIVSITIIAVLIKEFKILCFDASYGWALGFPIRRLDYLLMSLVALCTVVGLPAVGVVLVSALLIFPGVTARLWTDSFEWTVFPWRSFRNACGSLWFHAERLPYDYSPVRDSAVTYRPRDRALLRSALRGLMSLR